MPFATIQDRHGIPFKLYYERHGQGDPLILIRGMGRSSRYWGPVRDALSEHFEVIMYDNRGIGRSEGTRRFYKTATLAHDLIKLMDSLCIECAHIFGMSQGGMVAQEAAIRFPDRIRRAVIGCSHPGGKVAFRPKRSIYRKVMRAIPGGQKAIFMATSALLLSQAFIKRNPDVIQGWRNMRKTEGVNPGTLMRQLYAVFHHDTWERLPFVKAPSLILAGDRDPLVPPGNSHLLAHRIPNAKLEILKGVSHDFTTERPEQITRLVTHFLRE